MHQCNLIFLNIPVQAEVVFIVLFVILVLVYWLGSLTYQCEHFWQRKTGSLHVDILIRHLSFLSFVFKGRK